MSPRAIRLLSFLVGFGVATACLILLLVQGVPDQPSASATVATRTIHVTRSGCRQLCKKPQTTEGKISVESKTKGTPGSGGALERALDNDVGVTLIRLLFALLMGGAVALTIARVLFGLFPEPGGGVTASNDAPPKEPGGDGEEQPEHEERPEGVPATYWQDLGRVEETEERREENAEAT